MNPDPKKVVTWLVVLLVPVTLAIFLSSLMYFGSPGPWIAIVQNHFAATVGLPMAAVAAIFIVVGLKQSSGPIKFEGLGFKFEGAAGEVVLWVLCFLAIACAVKMLWSEG